MKLPGSDSARQKFFESVAQNQDTSRPKKKGKLKPKEKRALRAQESQARKLLGKQLHLPQENQEIDGQQSTQKVGKLGNSFSVPVDGTFGNQEGGPELIYEASPKHHRGVHQGDYISPPPSNGQVTLDSSSQIKASSPRRIGVDPENKEFVIFDRTHGNTYHGHTRSWDQLSSQQKNLAVKTGLVNRKGKFTGAKRCSTNNSLLSPLMRPSLSSPAMTLKRFAKPWFDSLCTHLSGVGSKISSWMQPNLPILAFAKS